MGNVVGRASDPELARIKLAWWREQLQSLDSASAPAEPRLQAVAAELLPRGISGAQVAEIEPGWATLLDEAVDPQLVADRGARLFTMVAALLGGPDAHIGDAGAFWALVATGTTPELRNLAAVYADHLKGVRFAMRLRGLSLLARLAAHDLNRSASLKRQGSRSRVIPALSHIWSGAVIPKS